MREQPKNVKSVNLVTELCNFTALLYSNIDDQVLLLLAELVETMIEVIQGNTENQAVLFDRKVVEYVNHLLQSFDDYAEMRSVDQIFRLHGAIATLLRFMTEENQVSIATTFSSLPFKG